VTTTFFLVRHAAHGLLDRTLCGRMAGVLLGEEGQAQAEAVAGRLAGESIAAIYTSPLERARATAAPIATRLETEARVAAEMDEIDFGEWAGRSFDELRAEPRWALWNSARAITRPPGGETMLEAQARALRGIERFRTEHGESGVVLVSHSDVIKAVLAFFLGLSLDDLARFEISPASVSTVAVGDWGAKVMGMNEVVRA